MRSFSYGKIVTMQISDVRDDIAEELISSQEISDKIQEVAAEVSADYAGKYPLLVAVLKGAVNTMSVFSQAVSIPVQIDFMSLSSYGSGTQSSGTITVRQDLGCDVAGRDVLIVEDIIFALLEKPARHIAQVDVKYKGFTIPDEFVVGFGLDYDEKYRNLDSIAVLKPEVYEA